MKGSYIRILKIFKKSYLGSSKFTLKKQSAEQTRLMIGRHRQAGYKKSPKPQTYSGSGKNLNPNRLWSFSTKLLETKEAGKLVCHENKDNLANI